MSRFSVAKGYAVDHIETLVMELLGGQQKFRRKSLWNVRNQYRAGAKEDQMVVWLTGPRRGAWKDFAGTDQGDAIDLVAFGLKGAVTAETRMDAVEWLEDRFNIRQMTPERKKQYDAERQIRISAAEAEEKKRREKSIARARKFFFSCRPIENSLADRYLATRAVQLEHVAELGRSLRFHPECEYWMRDDRPHFPAMVSAMVDVTGRIGACHYTFLKRDGSDKVGEAEGIEKKKAKLMFPETSGLVVRLTNGESGLSAEEAAENGVISICALTEGIEDGLSVALTNPELRVWAAGSLPGLRSVPDHASVCAWVVFKDNDWGKPQAQEQFDLAIARLKSFRKPVEVISMPAEWGKDVNDAIRSGWK